MRQNLQKYLRSQEMDQIRDLEHCIRLAHSKEDIDFYTNEIGKIMSRVVDRYRLEYEKREKPNKHKQPLNA